MTEPRIAHLDGDHLPETLARLDELIDRTDNVERLRSGLGMRLALTLAHEMREYRMVGKLSTDLVAGWTERFGQDSVDVAVAVAREFLLHPDRLTREFAERLQRVAADNPAADEEPPAPPSPPLKSKDL